MNINEQFDGFLAQLGVEMERPEEKQFDGSTLPEVSIFQASRDHYGVFYRLDLIAGKPELRVMVPVDTGETKMDIYLVKLSDRTPLNLAFVKMSAYQGSSNYKQGREAILQHFLSAAAEMMKQLFWEGDIEHMVFPQEIDVYPLLINDECKVRRRR